MVMPKLFWKIFLWFWGAMLIVNCAILFSILSFRSVSEQNRFKQFAQSMMSLQARKAAEIYESQSPKALSDYFRDFGQDTHFSLYRPDGSDVLGTPADGTTRLWISEAAQDEKTHFPRHYGPPLMLQATTGPSGAKYILFSEHASLPFAHLIRGGIGTQILRLLAVALAVAMVCLVLAHYIASPILHLQSVSRRIATGDLTARVRARLTRGRDEIADLSKDFNLMAEQIETLLHSQSQLLQAISHEMRSPLARLTLAVGLAKAASIPESDGLFERIETEAERIEQMLSQLLILARLDRGATSFPRTPVELSLLLSDIVSDASFEGSATRRSVILTHADPCLVDGSDALLRSAIENVIRNAIRYTRESSTVEVSLKLDNTAGQDLAVIHVTDEGPGVPSAELSQIFKPFYRVSSARERETGGIGLGLAITDRAVHLYQGSVSARNRSEGGLDVEIRLPVFPILPNQLPPTDGDLINA
ncbi:MAG: histidine kinase [Candidatus Acidoferrum typicum]|nr:histidine kinase [Candidatus Acidoferrum typicum]